MILHGPPRGEYDKVCYGSSRLVRGAGKDGENRGVGVIKGGAVDDHKICKIVFIRSVIAMPRHNVNE